MNNFLYQVFFWDSVFHPFNFFSLYAFLFRICFFLQLLAVQWWTFKSFSSIDLERERESIKVHQIPYFRRRYVVGSDSIQLQQPNHRIDPKSHQPTIASSSHDDKLSMYNSSFSNYPSSRPLSLSLLYHHHTF